MSNGQRLKKLSPSDLSETAVPASCSSRHHQVRDQGRWNELELHRIKLEIKSERMVKNSFIGSRGV